MTRFFIFLCCVLVLVLASCGEEQERPQTIEQQSTTVAEPPFRMPEAYKQRKTTVVRADFNGDRIADVAVAVYSQAKVAASIGFDSLLLFEARTISQDSTEFILRKSLDFYYGESLQVLDINNDNSPEIVVPTNTGGINPVISRGMAVIGYTQGEFRILYNFDEGAPEIRQPDDSTDTGLPMLVLWKEFLPGEFSELEGVMVLDTIIIPADILPQRKDSLRARIYRQYLDDAWQSYLTEKNSSSAEAARVFALYSSLVRTISYVRYAPDNTIATALTSKQEQTAWRKKLSAQYRNAIQEILNKSMPINP